MPQQGELEREIARFLEEERRGKQKPAPSASTGLEDEMKSFLAEEGEAGTPAPTITSTPKPQRRTPAYIPLTGRQEFGVKRIQPLTITPTYRFKFDEGPPPPITRFSTPEEKSARYAYEKDLEERLRKKEINLNQARREAEFNASAIMAKKIRGESLSKEEEKWIGQWRKAVFDVEAASAKKRREAAERRKAKTEELRKRYEGMPWPVRQVFRHGVMPILSEYEFETPEDREDIANLRAAMGISDEPPSGVANVAGQFMRPVVSGVAQIPRGVAEIYDLIQQTNPFLDAEEREMARVAPKIAPVTKGLEATARAMTPIDPTDKRLLTAKVPQALGSAAAFALGGAAGRALRIPSALSAAGLGAAWNVAEVTAEADKMGVDPAKRDIMVAMAAATGTTEILGLGRMLDKFGLKRAFIRRAADILEEGGQEALQQFLNNVNAAYVGAYDPTRGLDEGLAESALLGAIVGGSFQGLSIGAERLRQRRARQAEIAAVRGEQPAPLNLRPGPEAPQNRRAAIEAEIAKLEGDKQYYQNKLADIQAKYPGGLVPESDVYTAQELANTVAGLTAIETQLNDARLRLDQVPNTQVISLKEAAKPEYRKQVEAEAQPSTEPLTEPLAEPAAPTPEPEAPAEEESELQKTIRELKSLLPPSRKDQKKAEKEARQQEAERKRETLYNEAVKTAQEAAEEAERLIEAGDFSNAIGQLRAQQTALQQQARYLPETPEGNKERARLATVIESINNRIPGLRKQASAAQKPEAKPTKAEERTAKREHDAEVARRVAERRREMATRARAEGELDIARAAHRAELQAWKDAMRLTPASAPGKRAQIRDAITRVESDLREINAALREQAKQRKKAEEAPTAGIAAPLFEQRREPAPVSPETPTEALEETEAIPQTAPLAETQPEAEIAPTAPLPEAPSEPDAAPTSPVPPAAPTSPRTILRAPKATPENIEGLRERWDELRRLSDDRGGLSGDLADEMRELGSRIAEYDREQARAERGGRVEVGPPVGAQIDERPFARPTEEEKRRQALTAAEQKAEQQRVIERRREEREAAYKGPFGKFGEAARKTNAARSRPALAAHPELRDLLGLPEMPPYLDPETGKVNPAWNEAAQDTLNALAELGQVPRSSELFVEPKNPKDLSGPGSTAEGGLRGVYKRLQIAAERKGRTISESLKQAFRETVADALEAQEGFAKFITDERINNIRKTIDDATAEGRKLNLREKGQLAASVVKVAREYGLTKHFADNWFKADQAASRTRVESRRDRGRAQGRAAGDRRDGERDVPVEQRATGTLGKPYSTEPSEPLITPEPVKETETKEPPTVTHPDPAIDGKPIIAKTQDGRVVVENPANKGGVSVVKDRGEEARSVEGVRFTIGTRAEVAAADPDRVFAISQGKTYFTLWTKGRNGRWRYLSILPRAEAEAIRAAEQAMRDVASGKGKLEAFMGDSVKDVAGQSFGLITDAMDGDELVAPEHGDIGEERLGIGKKYPDVLVKDLFKTDVNYALWAADNLTFNQRGRRIADYLRARPEYMESKNAAIAAAQEILTPENTALLKDYGVDARIEGGNVIFGGKTYDIKDIIKEAGGRFGDGAWRLAPDQAATVIDRLRGLPRPARGQRGFIPDHVKDSQLGQFRRTLETRPDRSGLDRTIGEYVGQDTQSLLKRGVKAGIPESVISEQIEDVAKIKQAFKRGTGMFLLASEPGSGKTFVLGAAIRELRRAGAQRFVYVTLRKELIEQIKTDLADYGIGDVEFVTYPEIRTAGARSSDVLIFDEAHGVKNTAAGKNGAAQAKAAAQWIERAKFTIFSTATPFENPVQAAYLEPTGIFEPAGGFNQWALAYGASKFKVGDGEILIWRRGPYSDADAKAAREYFRKEGVFTSRPIRLPEGKVDARFSKVTAPEEHVRRYDALTTAAAQNEDKLLGFGAAWVVNLQKRILEASKVERGIEEARSALERGRFPIIFVETKAERSIDIPDLQRRQEEYDRAVMMAQKMRDRKPKRSDFGLPPEGVVEVLADYMAATGEEKIVIPSAEEVITKALGEENVAIFTGSVTPKKAQQNLDAWRAGKKKVIVATMAKGGTGLSLHDKKGNHPTTQIVINLPWTATQVKQVAQRNARYGLQSKAEILWIFADNIPFDRMLASRVGGRMADMGASVYGDTIAEAAKLEDWDLESKTFSEINEEMAEAPPAETKEAPVAVGQPARQETAKADPDAIVSRISQINPRAATGAPVSIADLRAEFPNLSKEAFDAEMAKLWKQGRVALHRHDYPASLSEAERNKLVKIGNDYFIAVTIAEKPGAAQPEARTGAPEVKYIVKELAPGNWGIIDTQTGEPIRSGITVKSKAQKMADEFNERGRPEPLVETAAGIQKYIRERAERVERELLAKEPAKPVRSAKGDESTVDIPRGDSYTVRYEVRELEDVQPSHDPFSFQPNPKYGYKNDRDYTNAANRIDVENQTKAGKFDPRIVLADVPTAADGPPVILDRGDVLGGNSRTMMIARVYKNHPADAQKYKDLLKKKAPGFGIDAAEIDTFKQPILVRVVADTRGRTQKLISDLNIQPGKALSATEAASARAKSLPAETMQFLADRLAAEGPDGTLAQALEGQKGVRVLNRLIDDGVIPQGERAKYLTDQNSLSPVAKQEIEGMLLGRLFRDADQMKRTPPEMRNKLIRVAPHLAKVAGTEWDISNLIPNAVEAAAVAKAEKLRLSELNLRGSLFGESVRYLPEELAIADVLMTRGPRQIEDIFRRYVREFEEFQMGTGLFGEPMTQKEAFADVFRMEEGGPEQGTLLSVQRDVTTAEREVNLDRFLKKSAVKVPLYHGTQYPGEITRIDPSKFDPNALYGPGFYMTQNPEVAAGEHGYAFQKRSGYKRPVKMAGPFGGEIEILEKVNAPNAYKFWANIENPFDIDKVYAPKEANRLVNAIFRERNYRDFGKVFGAYHTAIDKLIDRHFKEPVSGHELYREIERLFGGDRAKVNEFLRREGYDGITHIGGLTQFAHHKIFFDRKQAEEYAARVGGIVEQSPLPVPYVRDATAGRSAEWVLSHPNGATLSDTAGTPITFKSEEEADEYRDRFDEAYTVMGHKVWIAFPNAQVKSATGNRGTFDESDSILTSVQRGAPQTEPAGFWGTRPARRDEDGNVVATIDELIEDARSEFREHRTRARLYTNEQGAFVYAATINKATNAQDADVIPINVNGLAVPLRRAWKTVIYLRAEAVVAQTPAQYQIYQDMADNLEKAVRYAERNGDKAITIVSTEVRDPITGRKSFREVRKTAAHEEAHGWDLNLEGRRDSDFLDDDIITSDPDYERQRQGLLDANYPASYLTPKNVQGEVIAHLAAGQWQYLGYASEKDALGYLERLFDRVYDEFGEDALKSLRLRTHAAKGARENVIARRAERAFRAAEASEPAARREAGAVGQNLRGSEGEERRRIEGAGRDVPDAESALAAIRRGGGRGTLVGKSTPLRAIADAMGHAPLRIDPQSIAKETVETLVEALSRGPKGSLPGARAQYWAEKLGMKKTAKRFEKKQAAFIKDAIGLLQEVAKQSAAMGAAKRGSLAWETARRELDRARVKLSNHLSKSVEYTHPAEHAIKGVRASLLSALHIPEMNLIYQAWQFPFHEAQKVFDFLVPAKAFAKRGIKYNKAPVDIRTWAPAISRELGAIARGVASSFGDIADMLRYGITETQLNIEAAERIAGHQAAQGTTDKFEFGHRPKMIPGLDQAIMEVGRAQGAADVLFTNIVFATALAAEADATARKVLSSVPGRKFTEDQVRELARDLAADPSPAMIAVAGQEAARFRLDYPTLGYDLLEKARESKWIKKGGPHVESVWKAAFDWIFLFRKIPTAAIDTAFFRYSPIGMMRIYFPLVGRLSQAKRMKAQGREYTGRYKTAEAFGRDTAELFRQSIVGTLAWATLGALGNFGYLAFTGGGDDDKREDIAAAREALGEKFAPEMIVGDTALELHRMGPVGQAAAVGARVSDAFRPRFNKQRQEYEPDFERYDRAITTGLKGVALGTPLGQGAADIIEALESKGATQKGASYLASKARAVVPGLVRDVAKVASPVKVIPEDTSVMGRFKSDLQAGLPVFRKKLQPRLDALGRPVAEPNPFTFWRARRGDTTEKQLEELRDLDVGITKPARKPGESAKAFNERVRERGEMAIKTLGELAEDETMREATRDARRAIYERSLDAKQMERAGRLSSGSVRIERQIEALRGDAFAALRKMPDYQRLSEEDKKAVRDLIDEELKLFRATASSVDSLGRFRAEKMAVVPDWTPAELAKTALEARERQ